MRDGSGSGSGSRRNFLAGFAALGTAAALPGASAADTPRAKPFRIDVHHHLLPPAMAAIAGEKKMLAPALTGLTPEKSLAEMDRAGIATAVVSVASPGVWFGDAAQARRLARESNEFGAKVMADHRGRFGLFAVLPMPDIDGSLAEIAYALDDLEADGIHFWTDYGGKYLGDPAFTPVLEELHRRKAVVYVHPTTAPCCGNLIAQVPIAMIEYGTDTTRTIASLVFTGSAARFPDIRFIFSHAGGTMPFLIERFEFQARDPKAAALLPHGVRYELQRFHYELAQASNPGALSSLRKLVAVPQILFGTDFPYRTCVEHVENLRDSHMFTTRELHAVERDNAVRLMPRLQA